MRTLLELSEQLLSNLHEQLAQVSNSHNSPLQQSQAALPVCIEHIRQLRKQLKTFRNIPKDQEIHFFKHIKPRFVCEFYFNAMVYRLHYAWPMGDIKKQQHYLENKLLQINQFFETNHHFYFYYRTNSTHLDSTFFVRGQQDVEPSPEHLICGTDPGFYTPRDLMMAELLANYQFQDYLLNQLHQLLPSQMPAPKDSKAPVLVWSESKSAFMELIYGLHLSRAFNGGKCDIKTIVAVMSKTFGVELRNIYDYIYHIKMRKLEPTKFTDKMKACLLQNFADQLDLPDSTAAPQ
ncbi:RteC domain-containing protein [Pseudoflavitalea rhizosphaerae]|uniref:RteC domain-containing protein n=1 Tax=Pseudoflavitalea rhizosphaerae TaxID=1884793 RepID=UPI0013DFAA53|nr:RteC domain-containing protein [Pseudoflavitalea rhizosphaerae]